LVQILHRVPVPVESGSGFYQRSDPKQDKNHPNQQHFFISLVTKQRFGSVGITVPVFTIPVFDARCTEFRNPTGLNPARKHCLTQPRVEVTFHILLLDKSLLALRALEHLAEGEGDVRRPVPLRLVIRRPGLDIGTERAAVHLPAAQLVALHANGNNFGLLQAGSTAPALPLLTQILFVIVGVVVLLIVPVGVGQDGDDGDARLLLLLLLVLIPGQ
jgi:hypothetical protein